MRRAHTLPPRTIASLAQGGPRLGGRRRPPWQQGHGDSHRHRPRTPTTVAARSSTQGGGQPLHLRHHCLDDAWDAQATSSVPHHRVLLVFVDAGQCLVCSHVTTHGHSPLPGGRPGGSGRCGAGATKGCTAVPKQGPDGRVHARWQGGGGSRGTGPQRCCSGGCGHTVCVWEEGPGGGGEGDRGGVRVCGDRSERLTRCSHTGMHESESATQP
jgi:hypothetical protein